MFAALKLRLVVLAILFGNNIPFTYVELWLMDNVSKVFVTNSCIEDQFAQPFDSRLGIAI